MAERTKPRIEMVDRAEDGLLVSFADKRDVFYPASLLYALLTQVQEISESEWSDDE